MLAFCINAAALLFATPLQAAPLAPGTIAEWNGGALTEADFASWISGSLGNRHESVSEALTHLLQIQIVEMEAALRGVAIAEAEVDTRLAEVRAAVAAEDLDLATELKAKGMSEFEFRKLLADSLMHEKLARADLGLADGTPVSAEQLKTWTAERIARIFADASPAPDLALVSGPYRVTHAEVGGILLRTLPAHQLREFACQQTLESAMPAWGVAQGLALDDAVLVEEVEWRRRRVAENPNYQGATYEGLLAARGSSVDAVLAGAEIRVAGWLRLYARSHWPDAWFAGLTAAQAAELQDRHGPRREVSWLLLYAKAVKESELDLDPGEAAAELRRWKSEMAAPADFHRLAGLYSEHESSRRRGGRIGFVHRIEPGVDPLLTAAAFAAPIGSVGDPVPVAGGLALLLVHAEQPGPLGVQFHEQVRRARQDEARTAFLETLALRTRWDAAAGQ
jgi:hypothetical protein